MNKKLLSYGTFFLPDLSLFLADWGRGGLDLTDDSTGGIYRDELRLESRPLDYLDLADKYDVSCLDRFRAFYF